MPSVIAFTALAALLFVVVRLYRRYQLFVPHFEEVERRANVTCIPTPINGSSYLAMFVIQTLRPILLALPFSRSWRWLIVGDRQDSWINLRKANEKYGDTFMIVGLDGSYLKTSNAEVIGQVTLRRNDFLKPVERYKIVDIFGKNILTTEGSEWRRHRKIVGPSFSEKSNKLVFEESLRQAESMLEFWISKQGNMRREVRVSETAADLATLNVNVICAAGFGVPQLWPGESEDKLQGNVLPGFNTYLLKGDHTLPFKKSMVLILRHLLWLVVLPPWILKNSPFKVHDTVSSAFTECEQYFHELIEIKKKQMYLGESDKGTMDLMAPMIRASEEAPADFDIDSKVPGPAFSRQEIIGNCFILLQAGHETSANSLHFSMVCLAMNLASQRRMQADIDAIIGRQTLLSEVSYHTHMPRLYNSMVGAVFNEQLRLIPAILSIPKVANGEQVLWQDGKQIIVPSGTIVHLTVVGVNRNPRYWPSSPSKITNKNDDLDDFIPERWLPAKREAENEKAQNEEKQNMDGLEKASYDTNTPGSLFKPFKNSFLSFSEGVRACPGRRFAQVEITAVLTAIFQRYSVELDVADWASDEEVFRMGSEEKRSLYLKAVERAQKILRRCVQTTITLQMKAGDKIPMRFVERGHERFSGAFS